ncbi:MAG: isochorismatase family protein [Bacteriovoracaceae bacterium]|nr:isochorismatase family protein [Bacteriovoracaceae bacterium]
MTQTVNLNPADPHVALLVLDQQIDFEPGGALPVAHGDEILQGISLLMGQFRNVVLTQDSHPLGHISFASSHEDKRPFDILSLSDLDKENFKSNFSKDIIRNYLRSVPLQSQTLWPDHCVPGTKGWAIDPRLPLEKADLILRKGYRLDCDSYSAFRENDGTATGLEGYLRTRDINTVYLVGLTGDYCVCWSALDSVKLGFKTIYDLSLTRFVSPENKEAVVQDLIQHGIMIKTL